MSTFTGATVTLPKTASTLNLILLYSETQNATAYDKTYFNEGLHVTGTHDAGLSIRLMTNLSRYAEISLGSRTSYGTSFLLNLRWEF